MSHFLAGVMTGITVCWFFFWAVARDQEWSSSAQMKWARASWMKAVLVVMMAGVLGWVFWMNDQVGLSPVALYHVLSVLLIATALYDVVFRLIPSSLVILLIWAVFMGTLFLGAPLPVSQSSFGAVVVGGVVLLLYLLTKGRGIGEADIFLAGVIGALFGWEHGLLVFSVANFLGLLVILPLMALLGKDRFRQIPLVFFMMLAIFLEWYLNYCDLILTSFHLA